MAGNLKVIFRSVKEWISSHSKIVLPIIVLICVAITAGVALNANKKETEKQQAVTAEAIQEEPQTEAELEVPQEALEENAYPDINALISTYYSALAEGNVEAVEQISNYMEESEKIRIVEISKYIENYPVIDVYTKKGPVENSFVVYAYSRVKFKDYENTVPGMQAFYICRNEDGSYYINEGEEDKSVLDYIGKIALQDDVIDLNNKVAVEYNDLCANDTVLSAFLKELDSQIKISVGEILAASAQNDQQAGTEGENPEGADGNAGTEGAEGSAEGSTDTEQPAEGNENADPQPGTTEVQTVRTTDVVNIRSSDSQTADKLGKAQKGDTFTLLESKVNGWSRIKYNDGEAYIRSDFLEVVSTETVNHDAPPAEETNGYVTVIENVNIRSAESETSERLGVAYQGEKLELIMKQADGWCKVKYNGQTAYVKSDYVE